jgi:hypothetical protein
MLLFRPFVPPSPVLPCVSAFGPPASPPRLTQLFSLLFFCEISQSPATLDME